MERFFIPRALAVASCDELELRPLLEWEIRAGA